MAIGVRIRDVRKGFNLSQEALARRAGVSLSLINQIERGVITDPHYSTLTSIAGALGLTVAELLEESAVPLGEAPSPPPRTVAELLDAAGVEDRELEHSPSHVSELFEGLSYEETMDLAGRIISARRAVVAFIAGYEKDPGTTSEEVEALKRLALNTFLVNSVAIVAAEEAAKAEKARAEAENNFARAKEVAEEFSRSVLQASA